MNLAPRDDAHTHARAAPRGPALARALDGLALAATPIFALMALLEAIAATDPAAVLCSSSGVVPMNGMVTMYMLMGVFHMSPWLRLMHGRRAAGPGRG